MVTKELVIHRYTNQCKTVQLPPGFADFLKGTLYLYQSSLQIPNMELLVDFSHHPVGMFIDPMPKNMEKPYDEWIQKIDMSTEITECFNKNSYKVKEMLQMLREKDSNLSNPDDPTLISASSPDTTDNKVGVSGPYYLICHEAYEGFDRRAEGLPITNSEGDRRSPEEFDDIISENLKVASSTEKLGQTLPATMSPTELGKSFMKSVLRFNQEITEDCEYIKKTLNLTDTSYCVLHLRMGDHQSTRDHIPIPPSLEEFIQTNILPLWGKNVLVISDSFYTKKYLSEKYKITCTEFVPIHMGNVKRFWQPDNGTSNTDIGQTLIEFMLMSQSSQIFVYSVYPWVSGFSKVCSHIYDIPMTVIVS
jgi:hypothetical protein